MPLVRISPSRVLIRTVLKCYPLPLPQNTVALATDAGQMFGSIDASGNMNFTPVTRQSFMIGFDFLGVQEFIFNDSSSIAVPTNDWIPLTTGTSTHDNLTGGTFSLTGRPFNPDANGRFDGILVSAGNYGDAWTIASGTPYVEIWDANITAVAPIPDAAWLFSFGLIGLICISRCKKTGKQLKKYPCPST